MAIDLVHTLASKSCFRTIKSTKWRIAKKQRNSNERMQEGGVHRHSWLYIYLANKEYVSNRYYTHNAFKSN